MLKYYVVRDKNTGLYYRGKGVNKWGKYYNQASVYRFKKHAENVVEEELRRGANPEVVEIHIVETTNDVVEVVRCKDCKHFTKDMAIGMCKRIEDKPIIPMPYNNFCGFGERRSSDG